MGAHLRTPMRSSRNDCCPNVTSSLRAQPEQAAGVEREGEEATGSAAQTSSRFRTPPTPSSLTAITGEGMVGSTEVEGGGLESGDCLGAGLHAAQLLLHQLRAPHWHRT
eukprot:3633016-Rhodomonas_salina.1